MSPDDAFDREIAALREILLTRIDQHERLEAELHLRLEQRISNHESLVAGQFAELIKEHEFKRLAQKDAFETSSTSLTRQVDDARTTSNIQLDALRERVSIVEQWKAVHQEVRAHTGAAKDIETLEDRVKPLENFRGQAALIAAGIATVAGILGAAVARLVIAP